MFDQGTVLLESFLFDFVGDLYGQVIDVAFIEWIRPELKFDSIDELVRRMNEDSAIARAALARVPDAFPPLGEISS
jgi:riboflavin kinase/FMN adenylyltransferase